MYVVPYLPGHFYLTKTKIVQTVSNIGQKIPDHSQAQ